MLFWFKLRLSGSRNAAEDKGVSLAYDIGCVLQPDKQAKRSDKNAWPIMQVRSTVLAFHYDLQKQCLYRH